MTRRVGLLLAFVLAVAVGHVATILVAPTAIMRVAMDRLSDRGALINRFKFSPRVTAQSRWVVRPSPDLAYASCTYDLSKGPILVEVPPSPDGSYASVSVFAGNTDNIAVFDTLRSPKGIRFVLQPHNLSVEAGVPVVYSPSTKGIILDRRLAPTAQAFAVVDRARRADRCAPL
ncbi:DUF1254 domain-containing protein [Novosphingobium sp.]|uniref:DUF1254 domain-containing protein n=1 Tax=Novosphingobium sp. TaxID=1874826 RepID=UPI0038BA812B